MDNKRISIDPLTRTVISSAFVNIANEGVDVLDKTAISPILNEAQDRCLAITDADARLFGMCESGLGSITVVVPVVLRPASITADLTWADAIGRV